MKPLRNGHGGALAVYVTSHGFGHLNRTVAVLNRVPDHVPVTIKSHVNLFENWRARLRRPARLEAYVSDVGAVSPDGDSAATDPAATLMMAARCHAKAVEALDDEVARLVELETSAVLADAPAVPLLAAQRAGIPGFLMSNFTWADIYAPYARAAGGEGRRLVAELKRAYNQATATFRIEPAMRMSWLAPKLDAGMVVDQARNRRSELLRETGLSRGHKLVYIYVGRYGQTDLDWQRLERLAARGVHLISNHPVPAGKPANLHVVSAAAWPGGDVIASSDAVLAKAGYGTVCAAMATGTPMIYPPRRGFAEYRSLDRALRAWTGGVRISSRDFSSLNLERALDRALHVDAGPSPLASDGAVRIARYLTALCRSTGGRKARTVEF
jgi:UDP:flavonoid glycosyltransferase YjiC (YdhE family)